VSLGYGQKTVLEGLSFTFGAGRISVILGPGGSGKSTLLKVLGGGRRGASRPWLRGDLEMPATAPTSMPQTHVGTDPTGATLAGLLGSTGGVPGAGSMVRQVWRDVPAAVAFLDPIVQVPFEQLSRDQVRLAEFTAAVAGASLILLDEPEAGLAPDQQRWMVQCLGGLRGERTVILATHHLGVARAVADAAILLSDGKVVEAGQAPAFFDRPRHARTRQFVQMGS